MGGKSNGERKGTELHQKAWGTRSGSLNNSTGVSASSALAWKKDTTPEVNSRYRFASHRPGGSNGISSKSSAASSPPKFSYNYSSSFPEQNEEHEHMPGRSGEAADNGRIPAPRRGALFYNAHEIELSLDERSRRMASDESKGDGNAASTLTIDTNHQKEQHELEMLHKHMKKHDTHHDKHIASSKVIVAPALLSETSDHLMQPSHDPVRTLSQTKKHNRAI